MQHITNGNVRNYLQNNYIKISFREKLNQLRTIAYGLKSIHEKELMHRDFHAGNILTNGGYNYITDLLGLCRPANETNKEDKVFGVMPYVAPEVLNSEPYTKASDIYSFGVVAYEVLSGLPPYYNQDHDIDLALKICQGLRPQFQIKIPRLLEDLIEKC
jgi:serine/threonine protein kinase